MMNWLRLIRYKNLLIVFLTQLLVWYCLIYSSRDIMLVINGTRGSWVPGSWGYPPFMQLLPTFLLVSGSTILIAAAGYIINDYFDLKIDLINRPEKMVLEKRIPMRTAIIAHSLLNVSGFLLAAIVARMAGHYEWLLLQLLCTVLLWFYSTHFKKQFIVGNVVIAVLTALTIVVLVVYFSGIYFLSGYQAFIHISDQHFINPLWMSIAYCFFAFMTTWMREIVKDMEDYKGDAEEGCMTMPIKMGLQFSARFAQVLGGITIAALGMLAYCVVAEGYWILGGYTIAAILAPLVWWCYYLGKKNTVAHYHDASKWLKIIMLAGISSLIVYHFTN